MSDLYETESMLDQLPEPQRRQRRRRAATQPIDEQAAEPPTLQEALMSRACVIIAPRDLAERPSSLDAAKRAAIGGDASECIAPVMGQARPSRFRLGDLVVLAVPSADDPGNMSAIKLVGPIEVDRHWDSTAEGGAGSVAPGPFFQAVAKAAHPLYCARRDDNGTFELRLA